MASIRNGRYLLLSSVQHHFNNQVRRVYVRYAEKVINREGLESAANVRVDFRPGFDKLAIHRTIIHQDGLTVVTQWTFARLRIGKMSLSIPYLTIQNRNRFTFICFVRFLWTLGRAGWRRRQPDH